MKWSFQIARIFGIPIRIHATFFLLLLFVAIVHANEGGPGIVRGLVFILAIFGCVLLHELSHSLVARRYGIKVRDITLLPIGGVASMERMPEEPRQEFLVSIVGIVVNLVIAGAIYLWLEWTGTVEPVRQLGVTKGPLLEQIMMVNVFIAAFNLLPAFPMDGGRVLRSLLAQRMDYVRATQIAARIGQGMALLFGLVGLLGNPFLIFIALFVYMGAEQEAALVTMRSAFHNVLVRDAMITDFRTLDVHDPVSQALQHLLEGYQQDFPVMDRENLVGVLTRAELLDAISRGNERTPVGPLVSRDLAALSPNDQVDAALEQLRGQNRTALPVVENGRLVGLLTLENVGEMLMVYNARMKGKPR